MNPIKRRKYLDPSGEKRHPTMPDSSEELYDVNHEKLTSGLMECETELRHTLDTIGFIMEQAEVSKEEILILERMLYLREYAIDVIRHEYSVVAFSVYGRRVKLRIEDTEGVYSSEILFRNNGCCRCSTERENDSITQNIAHGIQKYLFGLCTCDMKENWNYLFTPPDEDEIEETPDSDASD